MKESHAMQIEVCISDLFQFDIKIISFRMKYSEEKIVKRLLFVIVMLIEIQCISILNIWIKVKEDSSSNVNRSPQPMDDRFFHTELLLVYL